MDTNDLRFQSAYNDLVGAFFRFINVVNPAPTRDDQIRLICNSMTALVNMLEGAPASEGPTPTVTSSVTPANEGPIGQPVATMGQPASVEVVRTVPIADSASAGFSEKRYAPDPTYTAEEIHKFLSRGLKKAEAYAEGGYEVEDFPYYLEFGDEEGVFTINPIGTPKTFFSGHATPDVVLIEGPADGMAIRVVEPGRIVKSSGGWEIVSPLKLRRQ